MFQTEINILLQSFASPVLTALMSLVSALGYPLFYIAALSVIIFGVDFRKGFVILQVLLVTAILTEFFKNSIALPRPSDVDRNVLLPASDRPNIAPFISRGADGFFAALPDEVVQFYRENPPDSYGFPSGHVSSAIAFWVPVSLLFARRWLYVLSWAFIGLMPLSRMYLGRHFLADVLGGALLAGVVVALAYTAVLRKNRMKRLIELVSLSGYGSDFNPRRAIIGGVILIPLIMMGLMDKTGAQWPASMLGMNVAFLLLVRGGLPDYHGTFLTRAACVVVAIGIYGGCAVGLPVLLSTYTATAALQFMTSFGTAFVFLFGGGFLSRKMLHA